MSMDAKQIIELFGGQTALAKLVGKGQSTVAYWAKTGVIPARWQSNLLALAHTQGINLSARDFVAGEIKAAAGFDVVERAFEPSEVVDLGTSPQESPFLFYASPDGSIKVQVVVRDETVWASQKGMAEIFDVTVPTINEHLQNVYRADELSTSTTIRKFRIVVDSGAEHVVNFYNLDAVISVGYRVNSYKATQFRKWATRVLKEYLIKGFVLDDERLKQGGKLFGKDYFEELLERIREIRASERLFHQKITDLYAECSVDYDPHSPITQQFYAQVQNKLHYAIHGHTSAELIELRADAAKPNMGLTHWKNAAKGGRVTKADVGVGKNYLQEEEADELKRLVSMYLEFAENYARRQKTLTMQAWVTKLNEFLEFNAYNVLNDLGRASRSNAERHAFQEYEKFRLIQDRDHRSDFDKVVEAVKIKKLPRAEAEQGS
jgi:hypothetical protein